MKPNHEIPILQYKEEFFTPNYPWALDLIDQQQNVFWRFNETNIDRDFNDLHNQLTPAEAHGIREVLRLFTQYEIKVGGDYWGDVIKNVFGQPEIRMLAISNSFTEVIHARAYNEINKVLRLDTEEFYTAYKGIPELNERMKFIAAALELPARWNALDVLKSVATFMFIEGAILYTGFAFIKHFSANGKNLLNNVNAAVDYSVRDEGNIHVTSNEMLFKTLLQEANLTVTEKAELDAHIAKIAEKTFQHEEVIIQRVFSKGDIPGITPFQLSEFIKIRINECCKALGASPEYGGDIDVVVKDWFYANITTLKMTDFFVSQSAQYTRNWDKDQLGWGV